MCKTALHASAQLLFNKSTPRNYPRMTSYRRDRTLEPLFGVCACLCNPVAVVEGKGGGGVHADVAHFG